MHWKQKLSEGGVAVVQMKEQL